MRSTIRVLLAAVLAAALFPQAAFAERGHGRGHVDRSGVRTADQAVVIDRDGRHRIVRDYYRSNTLPPGLAKRDSLPPGLAKHLRERGTLPPGLQKRVDSRFNRFDGSTVFDRTYWRR
jgi:hypothetical protein